MKCSHCDAEIPLGAQVCPKCGAVVRIDIDEFELQPEAPKAPPRNEPPPASSAPDGDQADSGSGEKDADGKKKKKAPPERPNDFKKEAKIFLIVSAASFLLPITFCLVGMFDLCGKGVPSLVGTIFAILAMLESMKVNEFYTAEDYEAAEKASASARTYIKVGIILALVSLVIVEGLLIAKLVLGKIFTVMAPKAIPE